MADNLESGFTSGNGGGFLHSLKNGIFGGELSDDEKARKKLLEEQAAKAGGFADTGQAQFGQLGTEAAGVRDYLGRVARGQESVSREQLRQGVQQNQASQQSMAASSSPRDAPMAAMAAMQNNARLGYGMSGQAAIAGIQERRAAQDALNQMIMAQRQQELQAVLGGRQGAMTGYGAGQPFVPQPGLLQQALGAAQGGAQMYATMNGVPTPPKKPAQ